MAQKKRRNNGWTVNVKIRLKEPKPKTEQEAIISQINEQDDWFATAYQRSLQVDGIHVETTDFADSLLFQDGKEFEERAKKMNRNFQRERFLELLYIRRPQHSDRWLDQIHLDQQSHCFKLMFSVFLSVVYKPFGSLRVSPLFGHETNKKYKQKTQRQHYVIVPDYALVNMLQRSFVFDYVLTKAKYYDVSLLKELSDRKISELQTTKLVPELHYYKTEDEIYVHAFNAAARYLVELYHSEHSPFKDFRIAEYRFDIPSRYLYHPMNKLVTFRYMVLERRFGQLTNVNYFKLFYPQELHQRIAVNVQYDVQLLLYQLSQYKRREYFDDTEPLYVEVLDFNTYQRAIIDLRRYKQRYRLNRVRSAVINFLATLPFMLYYEGFLTEHLPIQTDRCLKCQMYETCLSHVRVNSEEVGRYVSLESRYSYELGFQPETAEK